jgi:hypothetical protein
LLIVVLRAQLQKAVEAIVKRIADITEVTAPGVSVKLEKQINELAERTETLPDSTPDSGNVVVRPLPGILELRANGAVTDDSDAERQQVTGKYQRLAAEDPKAAVLVAFSDLEVMLRRYYEEHFGAQGRYVSFGKMVNDFKRAEVLNETVIESLREVSNIRNKIAHQDASVSYAMAERYIESIGNLLAYMILFNIVGEAHRNAGDISHDDGNADGSNPGHP